MKRQIALLLFILVVPTVFAWYDTDYVYRRILTVDGDKISDTVEDLPLAINVTLADLPSTTQQSGNDIIFVDSDDAQILAHEIEYYNYTTGYLVAWVRVNLTAGTDKTIYMYYNNSVTATNKSTRFVWDYNLRHRQVYHFQGKPTISTPDSANWELNVGTWYSMSEADRVDGLLGYAYSFDGADDGMLVGHSVYQYCSGNYTIYMWVYNHEKKQAALYYKWNSAGGNQKQTAVGYSENGYDNDYYNYLSPDGAATISAELNLTPDPVLNQWTFLVFQVNGTTDNLSIYENMQLRYNYTGTAFDAAYRGTSDTSIGLARNTGANSFFYHGLIDELRYTCGVLSLGWLNVSMVSQNDSSIISYGAASMNGLFVNISEPACSNSYTRVQAMSPATPWCNLTAPINNDLILGGDTLWIANGTYNDDLVIYHRLFDENVTIRSYTGSGVNLTIWDNKEGDTTATPNTLWDNISNSTHTLWRFNYSRSTCTHCDGSSDIKVWFTNDTRPYDAYYNGGSSARTWQQFIDLCSSTTGGKSKYNYDYCGYSNGSGTVVTLYSNDTSFDPRNVGTYVSKQNIFAIYDTNMSNNAYINITGITFVRGKRGLYILNTSNIIIENCSFIGQSHGIYIDGQDVANNSNIKIIGNYFDGQFRINPPWYGEDMNDYVGEKTDQIFVQDFSDSVNILNNTFYNVNTAIAMLTDNSTELNNSVVAYNTIKLARQSAIEIEDYCYNSTYYNNTIAYNSSLGVSFASANATLSPQPCVFQYNAVFLNRPQYWNTSTTYQSYAIKEQYISGLGWSNWYVNHNTFYGTGRAISDADSCSTDCGIHNNTFYDNIFWGDTQYTILGSGLAADGVMYDYNLYWTSNRFASRWNNKSATIHSTLAAALASPDNPTTWDANSVFLNPIIPNYLSDNFTPSSNSPACNMSTTNDFVGAFNCSPPAIYTTEPPNATFYPDNLTFTTSATALFYFYANTSYPSMAVLYANFSGTTTEIETIPYTDGGIQENFTELTLTSGTFAWNITINDTTGNTNTSNENFYYVSLLTGVGGTTDDTTATITWTSGLDTNATVYYGLVSGTLTSSEGDTINTTSHSTTVTGLTESTLYYYLIQSCFATTCINSSEGSFTTTAVPVTKERMLTYGLLAFIELGSWLPILAIVIGAVICITILWKGVWDFEELLPIIITLLTFIIAITIFSAILEGML